MSLSEETPTRPVCFVFFSSRAVVVKKVIGLRLLHPPSCSLCQCMAKKRETETSLSWIPNRAEQQEVGQSTVSALEILTVPLVLKIRGQLIMYMCALDQDNNIREEFSFSKLSSCQNLQRSELEMGR